eukprot:354042_1
MKWVVSYHVAPLEEHAQSQHFDILSLEVMNPPSLVLTMRVHEPNDITPHTPFFVLFVFLSLCCGVHVFVFIYSFVFVWVGFCLSVSVCCLFRCGCVLNGMDVMIDCMQSGVDL